MSTTTTRVSFDVSVDVDDFAETFGITDTADVVGRVAEITARAITSGLLDLGIRSLVDPAPVSDADDFGPVITLDADELSDLLPELNDAVKDGARTRFAIDGGLKLAFGGGVWTLPYGTDTTAR